jgi:hypothetical protein
MGKHRRQAPGPKPVKAAKVSRLKGLQLGPSNPPPGSLLKGAGKPKGKGR